MSGDYKWRTKSWDLPGRRKDQINPTIVRIGSCRYIISYGHALLNRDFKWIPKPPDFEEVVKQGAAFKSLEEAQQCFIDYDMLFAIERNSEDIT